MEWDDEEPLAMVQGVLDRLASSSHLTLVVVDEVDVGSGNWSTLATSEDVEYLLAASPRYSKEVIPPSCSDTLTRQMVVPHRNCQEIRDFLLYITSHGTDYLATSRDRPGPLPPGRRPLWVQRSEGITDREVLDRLEEELVGQSVTVVYGEKSEETQEDCGSRGWRYMENINMVGAEDGAVVLLDPGVLATEYITRGRNTLVIVTTQGR